MDIYHKIKAERSFDGFSAILIIPVLILRNDIGSQNQLFGSGLSFQSLIPE